MCGGAKNGTNFQFFHYCAIFVTTLDYFSNKRQPHLVRRLTRLMSIFRSAHKNIVIHKNYSISPATTTKKLSQKFSNDPISFSFSLVSLKLKSSRLRELWAICPHIWYIMVRSNETIPKREKKATNKILSKNRPKNADIDNNKTLVVYLCIKHMTKTLTLTAQVMWHTQHDPSE